MSELSEIKQMMTDNHLEQSKILVRLETKFDYLEKQAEENKKDIIELKKPLARWKEHLIMAGVQFAASIGIHLGAK